LLALSPSQVQPPIDQVSGKDGQRMLKLVGLMLATLVNWASAQSLPDSVYTCSVPAAELARAIEHIESRLGVEAARTCVLEHDEVFVKMGDGVYQGIAGWELTLRFRPCPSRDEDCALVLSTMDGGPYHVDSGPLPDCVNHPELCDFAIGRDDAVERARSRGLESGSDAYAAELSLYSKTGEFVWRVAARPSGANFDRVVLINARTGTTEADYEDKPCPR